MNKCRNCYFYTNVNIGGTIYPWCINMNCHGMINDESKAQECTYVTRCRVPLVGIPIGELTRNQTQQRNNIIKNRSRIFRFCYSIDNGVAIIISRFSHWLLFLSRDTECLYHNDTEAVKSAEYKSMLFYKPPTFHLHKAIDNEPMAIHKAFVEMDAHDAYVLKNRYYKNIR